MTAVLVISILTCIATITLVLFKPSITININKNGEGEKTISLSIFWVASFIGAILILAFGVLSVSEMWSGLTSQMWSMFNGEKASGINPIKILILFFSMTSISVMLDELGFFKYLALKTLKRAGTSQFKLFILLYLIVSILTIFTSNDIVILTFTPFICCFCINAKVNPIPYVIAEFVAANTWSMFLVIGNPTNIYLASMSSIAFVEYIIAMALPVIFGGMVAFLMLYLVFRKQLKMEIMQSEEEFTINDKPMLIIALVHLILCIFLLIVADFIGVEMWFVTLCFAFSLFLCTIIYSLIKKQSPKILGKTLTRIPWELAPFAISMFIIVLALSKCNVTSVLANFLNSNEKLGILSYGTMSALISNFVNNIPMSVLFSSMLEGGKITYVYAAIIGSNIGAFLTPLGALAGIMCLNICSRYNVKIGFLKFMGYGVLIGLPTLFASIGGLYLSSLFI